MEDYSKFEFKKVPLEDVRMVYELYCMEQKCEVIEKDFEKVKNIYKELLSRGNYTFACYINNKIIAVVNIYKNMQYYPTDLNAPYVHLECVIVDKDWQGQGIGTKLITKAVSLVKSEGCTYIIGQSSNPYMKKVFYKSGLTIKKYEDFRYENI